MKYLFFDLEFASSKGGEYRICEFGYVLTNENFKVLDRDNLIINPNIYRKEWDWMVVKKIITRPVSEYEHSISFSAYYNDIKKLIGEADYIFGHALSNDALALNVECQRYNRPSLDFTFYDVSHLFKVIYEQENFVSVPKLLDILNIELDGKEHDAESDAYNTMLGLKGILEGKGLTLEEALNKDPSAKDENKDYEVLSIAKRRKQKALKAKKRAEAHKAKMKEQNQNEQ